jgi:cardiolipin synthase
MAKRQYNKNLNVPNTLTVLRFVLIFPFIYFFLKDNYLVAFIILVISGITDMLDGWIARKYNQFTELGQMLDPLFDKLTQAAVVVCFAVKEPILIPLLAIFIIKESLMVAGAVNLISRNKKKPSGSKWYGKVATVLFYCSFGTIVALKWIWHIESLPLSITLLSITAAFMIYAFVRYANIYFTILHSDDPKYEIDIREVMDKKKQPRS